MDSHSQVNTWAVPPPGQQNMHGLIDFANIPNFADMTNNDPYPLRNTGPAGSGIRTDAFNAGAGAFYSNVNYEFQGFRGPVLPSDPGTLPEGSVHESQMHGTASVASHYGDDQSPEAQQTRDMFGTLALGQQQQQGGQPGIKRSSSVASSSKVSKVSKLKCSGCDTVCKTNSELSKHRQRHSKPFRCDHVGCDRQGGFGTANDLNRHKKSVHRVGVGPIYACSESSCGRLAAGKRRKTFARADNFRSHLRKLHNMELSTEALAKYHYYPTAEERDQVDAESNLETLDEEGSFIEAQSIEAEDVLDDMASEMFEDDFVMSDFQSVPQMQASQQQVMSMEASLTESGVLAQGTQFDQVFVNPSVFMPGDDINLFGDQQTNDADNADGVFAAGQWQTTEPLKESDSLSPDLPIPFPNTSFGPLGAAAISDAEDTDDGTDRVAADEFPSNLKTFDELVSDGVTMPAIMDFLRTVPRNLLEMALSGDTGSGPATDSQSQPTKAGSRCPTCNKLFQRQCELKKHMKRHDKPYVCTFKGCINRRFGSKNDWKRHESSQHDTAEQQRQSWVCRDPRCATKVHLFPTALAYRDHLFASHKVRDETTIHARLVEGVFGGRQDRFFWCGFCAKVMDGGSSSDSSSGPWNARCDHIDLHFSGKEMFAAAKFKDWKYLEDQAGMEQRKATSQGQVMGPPSASFTSSLGSSFTGVARSDTSEDTTSTLASNARKRKVAGPHSSRPRGSRKNGI